MTAAESSHRPAVAEISVPEGPLADVLAYEHPDIVHRVAEKLQITEADARALFLETRRFLYLCGTVPGNWTPPQQIDQCWHEFILWTRDYSDFCMKHFGRFVHHHPRRLSDPRVSRAADTFSAATHLFGTLSLYWRFPGLPTDSIQGVKVPQDLTAIDPCDSCGCNAPDCSAE